MLKLVITRMTHHLSQRRDRLSRLARIDTKPRQGELRLIRIRRIRIILDKPIRNMACCILIILIERIGHSAKLRSRLKSLLVLIALVIAIAPQ